MPDTQTYQPDLYDLVTPASFAGDVEWYVRKAKAADGPVLELGAGTGRVTWRWRARASPSMRSMRTPACWVCCAASSPTCRQTFSSA